MYIVLILIRFNLINKRYQKSKRDRCELLYLSPVCLMCLTNNKWERNNWEGIWLLPVCLMCGVWVQWPVVSWSASGARGGTKRQFIGRLCPGVEDNKIVIQPSLIGINIRTRAETWGKFILLIGHYFCNLPPSYNLHTGLFI